MAITAALVKELRDMTGAGMMDAKKALTETDGDMEAAVDWLRTKGLAKAAKKSGRTAAEGLVAVAVDGGKGVAVEVNSETDFVAKNAEFQAMVGDIAQRRPGRGGCRGAESRRSWAARPVADTVTDKIATIGENMSVRRMATVEGDTVVSYVHNAAADGMGKIGVLVALKGADNGIGKQIAMHIAAANPASLGEADLDPAAGREGKGRPDGHRTRIRQARGGDRKDDRRPDEEVPGRGDAAGPAVRGEPGPDRRGRRERGRRRDHRFRALEVGEGIEKVKEDFAAEVAKVAQG